MQPRDDLPGPERPGGPAATSGVLEGLTAAQIEAVTAAEGPLCVLAAAGAGKTRVLTRRVAHRAARGDVSPQHALVLTFTRRAAGELRDRLHRLGLRQGVAAGTFHSLAAAQLRQWWSDRGVDPPVVLERKSRLLGPLAAARPLLAEVPLPELAGHLEWAQARLVGPDEFPEAARRAGRALPVPGGELAALYRRYQDEKRRRRLVDFDDLLARCADAIDADPTFAAAQRWRWRHVFVDEFQDLNPLQHRLLVAWLGNARDISVVGDPHQAIYGWNGADPELLLRFRERWPDARVVHLDANHRCTPQIVAAAGRVLGPSGRALTSGQADGPRPDVVTYATDADEATGVAAQVAAARRAGTPLSQLAVLARTNAQLPAFQSALEAAGIAVHMPGEPPVVDLAAAPADETRAGESDDVAAGVTLCSFHRAKGLEWDEVWVCGLEDGLVPIGRASTAAAEAEERRLLYVAMTRASRRLHCSWARRRCFDGRPVPRQPSPWLAVVQDAPDPCPQPTAVSSAEWRARLQAQREALRARPHTRRSSTGRVLDDGPWPEADPALVGALRAWRAQASRASGVPAHVVLHDTTLDALALLAPRTEAELLDVPGLGPVKVARFGPTLLSLIARQCPAEAAG